MIYKVNSVNKIPIRLTEERWFHIVENHTELAGKYFEILEAVQKPDFICPGPKREFLAVKRKNGKFLIVVYREIVKNKDGFIITAFLTSKINPVKKKGIIWQL